MKLSGKSWEDFIENPTFDDKEALKGKTLKLNEGDLEHLWKGGHGLCTSFCVYVSAKGFAPEEIFNFGDQGHHRAAFSNDGIAIDSSARGAILCRPGQSESVGKTEWWMENVGKSQAKLFSVRNFNVCLQY